MLPATSPPKKVKSPSLDGVANPKTSITCSNVPEGLFDASAAKKHFSKFGQVQRIRLLPKRQMCIIEYEQPTSAEQAMLNAGAFDGFMFDVTRTKIRTRRSSKRDDDPDWVPDSSVQEELSAMVGAPTYRITRQKVMDVDAESPKPKSKAISGIVKQSPHKKVLPKPRKTVVPQPAIGIESPVLVAMVQTTLSTSEAAAELYQLRTKTSLTADEQWRTLDARDRILRSWGGAGSRVKVGGATIGTCPDMCPEKELIHRQAEYQVMTLETFPDSDGVLDPRRAVKQYSRSSADQEMPMCYELRPAAVLMRTCAYLLHEIADTQRSVSLADWFHFMWDRFRGIRKDITQQALCCSESIRLVEMCARFHAHCAARLADLEHTQFDQKLNTDNLTKCLQTLKHMYGDVGPENKPMESEFRGYVALLNLGDANFWWEIKQLPVNIQKSEHIVLAMKVFNAIDNNNYVRFFRLVREEATYLQACILLRYFNDVRARALARIVKAYAPRGGSRYPADELMSALAFESLENLKSFVNHYGLRFARTEDIELAVILDRNQFIEDSDPYPTARAIKLIESKRNSSVGEIIAGGPLPVYVEQTLFTSFTHDGKLKENSLTCEDQGYNTTNDSNKDIRSLKAEVQRLIQGSKVYANVEKIIEPKPKVFTKPTPKPNPIVSASAKVEDETDSFLFKPAIVVASTEIIKNSPEKAFSDKNIFSFSKPQETVVTNIFGKDSGKTLFESKVSTDTSNIFGNKINFPKGTHPVFGGTKPDENVFKKSEGKSVFCGQTLTSQTFVSKPGNVFGSNLNKNKLFSTTEENEPPGLSKNIFSSKSESLFTKADNNGKSEKGGSIFASSSNVETDEAKRSSNIFGSFARASDAKQAQSVFANGDAVSNNLSPSSLFKSVNNPPNGPDSKTYSIFQSKNKAQTVADNILNSINAESVLVYEFNQNNDEIQKQLELKRQNEERIEEDARMQQETLMREDRRQELLRQEERRKEEARKKQELKILEEKRRKEEQRKQEELKKIMEEERKAEQKRRAEEKKKKFKERVERESETLIEELINEVQDEIICDEMNEELEKFNNLMDYASNVTEEIITELCNEISESETKAEKYLTNKIMRKWFHVWQKQYLKNIKRRELLEDTPVWLCDKTPLQEAACLRRYIENAALINMNAIHRGYKFTGELKQLPPPEPYNIMEIIRSSLLKRMKQISYPYDKCFFWKVTLVSPGAMKWMHKKINIEKWLLDLFSDRKKHDASTTLIHVGKQSWNHLMDFAISVSLATKERLSDCSEAIEGSNGVIFYVTEKEINFSTTIEQTLKHKYPYQVIPVAVVISQMVDLSEKRSIENTLHNLKTINTIAAFRIFEVESQNISYSLDASSKRAMKWLAKNFPQVPPLEIDYLKSICQRYLGNEIWCMLRSVRDDRMNSVLKDIFKLIKCYNAAVDKLIDIITKEDLFNYSCFPLEFQSYLDGMSPYPKPYEFIPSCVKNTENITAIKSIVRQLKLPNPSTEFNPLSASKMQEQIRTYCNQIGWFEDPEDVVCKVIAVIPNELSDTTMCREDFTTYFAHYDLIDFLNVVVYEKICRLNNFDNRFAIYEKVALENYRNTPWLLDISAIKETKHKVLDYEDDIDFFIEAKRRKIEIDSLEYLMLEDKDATIVEESMKQTDETINRYNNCSVAVKQLELQLEEEKKKSLEFENLLKAALADC